MPRFKSPHPALSARRLQLFAAIVFLQVGLSQRAAAFNEAQKFTALAFQFGTDSFAATNRFGGAFTSPAQGQINTALQNDINNGTMSILFEMPGLTNLAGNNQPSLNLGVVNADPVLAPGYVATSDLDWWYSPDQAQLDTNGVPTNQLTASITASVLNSSGGRFSLTPSLFNNGGRTDLSSVVIKANAGLSSAVTESANGLPPGHLAAENIPVGLQTFASMSSGKLKGNMSAASLAATPISTSLVGNGSGFTATNTWLDVMVGGYTEVIGISMTLINATQPDQSDPAAPVLGAGPPYKFLTAGKSVTGAQDKNGTAVSLSGALNAAAYSCYLTFTTSRVIAPPPALLSIANSPNGLVVSWSSYLTGWTLQASDSLTNPNWSNYTGVSGNSATINPPATGNLYFRLNY